MHDAKYNVYFLDNWVPKNSECVCIQWFTLGVHECMVTMNMISITGRNIYIHIYIQTPKAITFNLPLLRMRARGKKV